MRSTCPSTRAESAYIYTTMQSLLFWRLCKRCKNMEKTPLRDAFVQRKDRFYLLDKGVVNAGFTKDFELLEIGCASGEAAQHLSEKGYSELTGIDIDAYVLERARATAPDCRFICADACALPFEDNSFRGIFSEAAFAVIPDKAAAAAEYFRVLKKNGRLLLNDFVLRQSTSASRQDIEGIPCLEGVQAFEKYIEIFRNAGFKTVYMKEEYPELIRIASSLSRRYGVPMSEIGSYIQCSFGNSKYVNEFFKNTKMSYYQIVFEKE